MAYAPSPFATATRSPGADGEPAARDHLLAGLQAGHDLHVQRRWRRPVFTDALLGLVAA